MSRSKRVLAALMAALVIFTTAYNSYTMSVQATGVIEGSILIDLLIDLAISAGIIYMGNEASNIGRDTYEEDIINYCLTVEGYNELLDLQIKPVGSSKYINVAENFGLEHMVNGSNGSNKSPDPDTIKMILAAITTGIIGSGVLNFISKYYANRTASSSESTIGAAVNAASEQDVFFVNPLLPENVYIGLNHSVIPGLTEMDEFDNSLSHIQFYYSGVGDYVAGQIDYIEYNGGGRMFYNALSLRSSTNGAYTVRSRMQYIIEPNGSFSTFGCDNPAYTFTSSGSVLHDDGFYFFDYDIIDHPVYISPSKSQPVIYEISVSQKSIYYMVYESGVVVSWADGTATSPSGVTTDTGALSSVKPIVGMDISSFIDAIGKNIAASHPDEDVELSPEAISQIYNNVSNVYDNAVTNYYSDTSYIDQSQYITNITNVFEQAIADSAVVDSSVPVSSTLGSISGYTATGLSSVFPFCIPFDMYDLMSILAADPKAISFDYTFYFGEYFGEYTYYVDLSVFDPVMQVVRTMELLVYIFGLMLVTRNLIRG